MKSTWFKLVSVLALAAAFSIPARSARANDAGSITADILVGRPLCLVATIVGGAVFVLALPVAATSGSIDGTAEALVLKPARATFTRPLGDFDSQDFSAKKAKSQRLAHHKGKAAKKN